MRNIFKKSLLFSAVLVSNAAVYAQADVVNFRTEGKHERCSTTEYNKKAVEKNPEILKKRAEIERFTQNFIKNKKNNKTSATNEEVTYTIPVVVHVVYNNEGDYLSMERIQSQIDVLNADFARMNEDAGNTPEEFAGLAANINIQFELATIDPDGNATNGVTYTETNVSSWTYDDKVKFSAEGGKDAWNTCEYLNMWACNLGGGLLGYAQFPGGDAATDGVVIGTDYFGVNESAEHSYNLGRTATHEVGHWLNLYHIWGDDSGSCSGSDEVDDTPNAADSNYGCPDYPVSTSCSDSEMFMNYMDYVDDACMNMFTYGQKDRMRALFVEGGDRFAMVSDAPCEAGDSYCASSGGSSQYDYINKVTAVGFSNTSGSNGGYSDFTEMGSIRLRAGSSNSLYIYPKKPTSLAPESYAIWVDFDQSGSFDEGERVFARAGVTSSTLGARFTLPSFSETGKTRMRISMKSGKEVPAACDQFAYGEVEDYSVDIQYGFFYKEEGQGEAAFNFELYPNPVKDILNVRAEGNVETLAVKVFSITGAVIMEQELNGNDNSIDVSKLQNGMYILSIASQDGSVVTKKFTKE